MRTETALPGWAYRIRTGESVRALSDWNCAATSPEVGAIGVAEIVRAPAAWGALQLKPRLQQMIFKRERRTASCSSHWI
jgi:hypothetical protein